MCVKITFVTQYKDEFELEVRWLFIKYKLYPPKDEKPEKEKKDDKKDPKKDKKPKKSKKTNPFKKFYNNQGLTGVVELINTTASIVNGMFKRIFKSVVINTLDIAILVTGEDSAKTAVNYGEVCAAVFPPVGLICSTMLVKKHDINITPDFIGSQSKAYFSAVVSVVPIRVTNAAVIFLFQFLFKVLLKFFLGGRKEKVRK